MDSIPTDNIDEYPPGYMTGVLTIDLNDYCASIEGPKHRKKTATLT
jgi:hypothetical protein